MESLDCQFSTIIEVYYGLDMKYFLKGSYIDV
jgi:hypothetical protein